MMMRKMSTRLLAGQRCACLHAFSPPLLSLFTLLWCFHQCVGRVSALNSGMWVCVCVRLTPAEADQGTEAQRQAGCQRCRAGRPNCCRAGTRTCASALELESCLLCCGCCRCRCCNAESTGHPRLALTSRVRSCMPPPFPVRMGTRANMPCCQLVPCLPACLPAHAAAATVAVAPIHIRLSWAPHSVRRRKRPSSCCWRRWALQ